jgi:hypothetical protein
LGRDVHVVLAFLGGEVATVEKEVVDSVRSVLSYGGVVETIFMSAIGGKGGKKLIKIGLIGAVRSES